MIYNAGWDNLIPQERKYTAALAASAAKMLESGESPNAPAAPPPLTPALAWVWSVA